MRSLLVLALFTACAAIGQEAGDPGVGRCAVTGGPPVIGDQGRFVRPAPTADQCLFAADLMGKVVNSERRALRRVTNIARIPEPVIIHLGRMVDYGAPWNRNVLDPTSPAQRQHVTTWVSPELVVVLYRTQDYSGIVTSVFITDLTNGTSCDFPRWPSPNDPRTIAIEDIRDVLEDILSGKRKTPTCRLSELPID